MNVSRALALVAIAACATPDGPPPRGPTSPPFGPVSMIEPDAFMSIDAPPDAAPVVPIDAPVDAPIAIVPPDAPVAIAPPDAAPVRFAGPEEWLKGSTHVHAKPSGDSKEPIPDVIKWYETRGYDFIALTDHNRTSEVGESSTAGSIAVRNPPSGLIVLAGVELTNNPTGCLPPGDESGRCRIHVNLIGNTGRVMGKLEWANRKSDERVDKYQNALDVQKQLGGMAQLNHPNWYWGMTADVLFEVLRRGVVLVEIANSQFEKWNKGDADHPSMEALWDTVLVRGATMWGVASDDAHDYNAAGKYPAGGAFVVVRAARDPQSIVDALAAGRFYSSTGVMLDKAFAVANELVVEVAKKDSGSFTIEFVENGKIVKTLKGKRGKRAVPLQGYVRAVVTRGDGKKAWVQPARR